MPVAAIVATVFRYLSAVGGRSSHVAYWSRKLELCCPVSDCNGSGSRCHWLRLAGSAFRSFAVSAAEQNHNRFGSVAAQERRTLQTYIRVDNVSNH